MTENQKLREALRETLLFCETFSNRWDGETGAHPFDMVERARQALATTEPAVNQQLTTDPFDEREAFESEMRSRHGWNNSYFTQSNDGGYLSNRATYAYIGWQARAALREKEGK